MESKEINNADHKGNYASYSTAAQWQIWCAAIRHLAEQNEQNEQRDSHE